METFISTSDGRHSCLRHKGVLYYCSPDELAAQLGITEFTIELDPGQRARDLKEQRRERIKRYNASLPLPWGY